MEETPTGISNQQLHKMSAVQPNETEEIPEVREKDGDTIPPLSTQTHATAASSSPESTASSLPLSSPPCVLSQPETEQNSLPEGIKSSYCSDLDLLEDLWKVGIGALFCQGDIYVGQDGKTICKGKEIIYESLEHGLEHDTLKEMIARFINEWGRNTHNEQNLLCESKGPVFVSRKYKGGVVCAGSSVQYADVAVYSGDRQSDGIYVPILAVNERGTVRRVLMSPQILIQIGVTNLYATEKDNMDAMMNYAGVEGFTDCQRPNVGYFIKLLHNGSRNDNGNYTARGFLVIKVLRGNRMPPEENAMDANNNNLEEGRQFLVDENGAFGPNDEIDLTAEVGINVAENQRSLVISLNDLRRDLVRFDGTVFQQ